MPKNKKLTYNQLANYIVDLENRHTNAMNAISQTIASYVEFKGDNEEFMEFLKGKYEPKKGKEDKKDTKEA